MKWKEFTERPDEATSNLECQNSWYSRMFHFSIPLVVSILTHHHFWSKIILDPICCWFSTMLNPLKMPPLPRISGCGLRHITRSSTPSLRMTSGATRGTALTAASPGRTRRITKSWRATFSWWSHLAEHQFLGAVGTVGGISF